MEDIRILAAALCLLGEAVYYAGVTPAVNMALVPRLQQLGFDWEQAAALAEEINSLPILDSQTKDAVN